MTIFYYLVCYAAAAVFALACLARILMYARAPLHLRWELYPVPHEDAARVTHGGSRFEEVDWWTKPARFNLAGEVRFMVPEMLFLKGLHECNPKLWYRSFPFHLGLYLLAGTAILLVFGAAALLLVPGSGLTAAIRAVYPVTGAAGLALTFVGAAALLLHRMTDPTLHSYTTAGDVFNLVFFMITAGALGCACLGVSSSPPDMLSLARGMLTLDAGLDIPGFLGVGLVLAGLLVAYIPLTHMSHFIAKYFTYHAVRWDVRPNRKGGKLESRVAEYLTYRPTWSAAHIGADGKKSWAQIAAANPALETKK